jgi:hypothetical protein
MNYIYAEKLLGIQVIRLKSERLVQLLLVGLF